MNENKIKAQQNATRAERRAKERREKEQAKQKAQKMKEAINMLNSYVKLKLDSSALGGVGVVALRDIKKGEKLYATAIPCLVDVPYKDFKKIRPEVRQMILEHFPLVMDDSHFMCPDTLMQIYIRHSDTPNYDNTNDTALKKIKEGEELFGDYRNIKNTEKIFGFLKK